MCAVCGCSETKHHVFAPARDARMIKLEVDVLAHNDRLAAKNRAAFARDRVLALNLVSSPGSGKTTLIERTIRDLTGGPEIAVIEGDQATELDAERIRAAGARALQINTGTACHLDAKMIEGALRELAPAPGSVLFVENVGNLVCPALFDLGERAKVVVASVTEGEEKPLKYPHMFKAAELVLLNKIDLLPYVAFDPAAFATHLARVHSGARLVAVSATRGDGMREWYEWLRDRLDELRG
jgi:hydrogenase nickel incorporation protein HypB